MHEERLGVVPATPKGKAAGMEMCRDTQPWALENGARGNRVTQMLAHSSLCDHLSKYSRANRCRYVHGPKMQVSAGPYDNSRLCGSGQSDEELISQGIPRKDVKRIDADHWNPKKIEAGRVLSVVTKWHG